MIKLISTDFDGTLFAEFEDPPVPVALQELIGRLQEKGAKWVINTGRDLSSLMEALGRARLPVKPDFLVLVEREIYRQEGSQYVEDTAWNRECYRAHAELFRRVQADVPRLCAWVEKRTNGIFFADSYSPFCLISQQNDETEMIDAYLKDYCDGVPNLTLVRNDVSVRFSHGAYNKGTGLAEIARQLKLSPGEIFAAGDHLNDLPMLSVKIAGRLAAPANAVPAVKQVVLEQGGFVSELCHGHGVAEGLEHHLNALKTP